MAKETAEEKRKRLAGASTVYKTTPEHGDVSATGRTGPKAAPHSGKVQPIADPKRLKTMKATRTPSNKRRITTGDSRDIVMVNPKTGKSVVTDDVMRYTRLGYKRQKS